MQKLLIATKNPGKFGEIKGVLSGLPFEFLFLGDLDEDFGDVSEDGETFYDNAFLKARYFADKAGLLTLAEDSGILIDAFPGEFGVKTRRWGLGEGASDEEWIVYFMEKMKDKGERGARFTCNAVLVDGDSVWGFEGETPGSITEELMAPILPGLPLSSCFMPEGFDKVYAGLTREEKNEISHRGQAILKVRKFLEEMGASD
ncbi:MAG: non-canonical purine NTP pyrophosphatase [Patescibacteria group bacterium]|nr:non-canonical purine NTP pyrophosphatase [Patescibacteria group bacterium]